MPQQAFPLVYSSRPTTVQHILCKYMAQYEEFVIIFSAVIGSDTISVSDFNELVQQIDRIMADHLGEG